MPHIFIDESGQFTKHNHERYFTIASFTTNDTRRTAKGFRAWCKSRFPKKMRGQNEIKWSATGITNELRLKTLRYISRLGIKIHFTYLLHENIPSDYKYKDKLRSGLLYTNIVGELLDDYLPVSDKDFQVFCDRRRLSGIPESEFKKVLLARMLPNLPIDSIIQIKMIDSGSNPNIQIADWIAGALSRYLENGHQGEEFYNILKNNIVKRGRELFQSIHTGTLCHKQS